MKEMLIRFQQQARLTDEPAGAFLLAALMALYYSTVVLAGLHFVVLQIVAIWGIALMIHPSRNKRFSSEEKWIMVAITLIFVVAAVSYIYNQTWKEEEANLSRYARFLLFIPLYFVVRRHVTGNGFWLALLLGTCATGIWGLLEFSGLVRHPDDRLMEVSGAVNSIQFGDIALTLAVMTAAGLPVYRRYGRGCAVFAATVSTLAFFACLLSETRGAWIAIPALGLVLVTGSIRAGLFGVKSVLVVLLLSVAVSVFVVNVKSFQKQVGAVGEELASYQQGVVGRKVGIRLEMWRASWMLFAENPVLGVGPGLYHQELSALVEEGFDVHSRVIRYSHPHSEYFFVLATLGAMGCLALLLFFGLPLWYFVRAVWRANDERRWLGLAGTLLVVGYLHFGLTEALLFQHATFLGLYMLTVAALIALLGREESHGTPRTLT